MMLNSLALYGALIGVGLAAPSMSSNTVRASTGYYTGQISGEYPDVKEWLSIPYGQDTSGSGRFQPPKAVPLSSEHYDVTAYPPACPQYVSAIPTIWNQQIPQYLQYWGAENNSAGVSAPFASEDCLKLAVWTPANATEDSNLPVAMFWTGGGFQTNGILVPGQLPPRWVSRTQSHIVVTINYRMNILGFPNAFGVEDQNLGLLDMRVALEWVRDNIRYFGGDPSKIMIWGQSAGASAVDYHHYAYWDDPIAHAFFAQSGNVLYGGGSADWDHTNFTFVAKNVGCDFPMNSTKELECMQQVDYNDIINFMGQYQDNSTLVDPDQPGIRFSAIPDEKIVFANYTERYLTGKVAKAPMIYSSAANEGGSLAPYPVDNPLEGPNQTVANSITERILCGAANSSIQRDRIGLTTYRYQYAGNWTNQDPLPWMGAFHSSDLVMLFGSYAVGQGPPKEELEGETSRVMEDYLLAFIKDPYNGPPSMGWVPFNTSAENQGTMLRFGADGKAVQNVSASDVEAVCSGSGPYNPFP
ncbi:acetylcholinesterase [Hortaea werneckii]|nr:acetylcholinesterase [Hortaea werneckii]